MTNYAVRGYPCTQTVLIDYDAGPSCTWSIFDPNNDFIVGGSGLQNPSHPTEYSAVFTIPTDAYCEADGSTYRIEWETSKGFIRDNFLVFPDGEPIRKSTVSIVMDNNAIKSQLVLPIKATSVQAQLYHYSGKLLEQIDVDIASVSQQGRSFVYNVTFTRPAQLSETMGRPYIVLFNYSTLAGSGTEMYQVYVPHFRELKLITDAKIYLDLLNNVDVNPRFRITPEILMPFIPLAIDRLNGTGTATNWNIITIPSNLDYALQMCLRHEYTNARYLSEGMSSFDFQGASTQLNVDRTQYWQTKMDEIGNWLQENLEKLKNNAIRAGSPGAISFGFSPVLNRSQLTSQFAGYWTGSVGRLLGY